MSTLFKMCILFAFVFTPLSCRFNLLESGFSVYGTWRWVRTQGAWTGSIYTPELSGTTAKVVFQEDGVARFYRDGTLVNELQFSLSKTHILSRRKEAYVIHWSHKNLPDNQYILFEGNDTLHITERTTEISHYYYVRDRN